jgi:hypothetical protein
METKSKTRPVAQSVSDFCDDASISVAFFYKKRAQWLAQGKPDPLDHMDKRSIVFPDKGEAFVRALAAESKIACEPA